MRKHQTWLWGAIITLTIISFLYWSPNMNIGGGSRGGGSSSNLGSIGGKTINSQQYTQAADEVRVFAFLMSRKWYERSEFNRPEMAGAVYERLVLIHKLNELNVRPTEGAMVEWIKRVFTGGNPTADFDYASYQRFLKEVMAPQGISQADFERFARHEMGREHLQAVYGVAGALTTSAEVADLYHRENDLINSEAVIFTPSSFVGQVTVKPEDIENFYKQNQATYFLPPRVKVNFVKFAASNYLAEAEQQLAKFTNLTQNLEVEYAKRTNESKTAFLGMTKEAAVKQLHEDAQKEVALGMARRKANEFLLTFTEGHDETHPFSANDLAQAATKANLNVQTTPLFSRDSNTNEVGLPQSAITAALRLNNSPEDKAHEGLLTLSPVVGGDAAYVLSLVESVPATPQPLEAIRNKVTEDFKKTKAVNLAQNAGFKFGQAVVAEMAKGKSFDAICKEHNVKPTTLDPFSLRTTSLPGLDPSIDLRQLKEVAVKTPPGKASEFIAMEEGGFVLHVKSHTPADAFKMQADLPKFTEQVREQREMAAYQQWFQKQMQDLHVVAPLAERQQKPNS